MPDKRHRVKVFSRLFQETAALACKTQEKLKTSAGFCEVQLPRNHAQYRLKWGAFATAQMFEGCDHDFQKIIIAIISDCCAIGMGTTQSVGDGIGRGLGKAERHLRAVWQGRPFQGRAPFFLIAIMRLSCHRGGSPQDPDEASQLRGDDWPPCNRDGSAWR